MSTTDVVFTENPWRYCQLGEHDRCAANIQLIDRTELCPCLCHAPDQPAREGEGWYQLPDENGNFDFYTDSGKRVGRATSMEFLQCIITDHARAALVPGLVEALEDLLRYPHERVIADRAQAALAAVRKAGVE